MGRARGYASHAATRSDISRFDAVLGARRGFAATREVQDVQARDHALTGMIAELKIASGTGTVIDCLTEAYRSGGAKAGTPEYKKLRKDLELTQVNRFKDLAKVAAHGDPRHWPGLTAPAVAALGTHLHVMTSGGEIASVANRMSRAMITTDAILAHEHAPEQHERLAPVMKGLAEIIHHLPGHEHGGSMEMLRRASTQALAGPMQPLVQAFRYRILDGRISAGERRVLEQIITVDGFDSQREKALRPIEEVL